MRAKDLKNSILQLAVSGKLVPQDASDEPAVKLLERIRAERESLIKQKKIKNTKVEPITDEDIPFEVPESWEWVRLGEIVNLTIGKTPSRHNQSFWSTGTIPWVSISDMKDGDKLTFTKEKISVYALEKCFKSKTVPKETLIMSFKLTIGKVSIMSIEGVHNEAIVSVVPFVDDENIFRDYLFHVLPLFAQGGDTKSAIKGQTLNSKSLTNLLLPLPPLAEQKRIVQKVREVMRIL